MGYNVRAVGKGDWVENVFAMVTEINKGWDAMTYDPIITVNYETGAGKIITHVIPYKDVELIYAEDGENIEEDAGETQTIA
jgi:hypothetical protein